MGSKSIVCRSTAAEVDRINNGETTARRRLVLGAGTIRSDKPIAPEIVLESNAVARQVSRMLS
jgi:hypothetical protein